MNKDSLSINNPGTGDSSHFSGHSPSSTSSLEAVVKVTYLDIMIHMLFPHAPLKAGR